MKDKANGVECRVFGAAAIMRMPARLRIAWQDDNTLKIETDAGQQTRLFHFGSIARDEAREDSDVDVCIKTKTPDPFALVHIKEEIESRVRKHVDIVRIRKKMNPFLKERIEKEGVYV